MLFGRRTLNVDVDLNIRTVSIERVRVTKFIGVNINVLINWNYHVKYVKSKLSKSTAILNRCSQLVDRNTMYVLYCSIFLAIFNILLRDLGKYVPN